MKRPMDSLFKNNNNNNKQTNKNIDLSSREKERSREGERKIIRGKKIKKLQCIDQLERKFLQITVSILEVRIVAGL